MSLSPEQLAALQQQMSLLPPGEPVQNLLPPSVTGAPPPATPPLPQFGNPPLPPGITGGVGPLAPPAPTPQVPDLSPAPAQQVGQGADQGLLVPSPQPQFAAPGPTGALPPPPGDVAAAAAQGANDATATTPEQAALQNQIEAEAELQRSHDADDENLGEGARPRRRSSMKHPLEMAAAQISSELQMNSKRLAADLFPNGPAGTIMPSKQALGAYMRRHWDDPTFRSAMLNRMAPKGPDGNRVPWGVRNFLKLFNEEVAPYRLPNRITPPQGQGQPFQPPAPPAMPAPPAVPALPQSPPPGVNPLG